MTGLESRFDWYAMTFDSFDDGRERAKLSIALGARLSRSRGRNGYAECYSVERDGSTLAQVYGRSARTGEVHIVTTSDACDEVVPLLREFWPSHRVSRADSSVDFAADFDELDKLAVAFAVERGLSYRLVSDSEGGATRYLGSRSSELMVRVYKKSEQLLAKHPEAADSILPGIVRFELEAKPGKRPVKEQAATMTADDLWGLGAWSKIFAGEILGIDSERVSTHFRRPADWNRALHFFTQQYAPMIQRRSSEYGTEQVRAELLDALGLQ